MSALQGAEVLVSPGAAVPAGRCLTALPSPAGRCLTALCVQKRLCAVCGLRGVLCMSPACPLHVPCMFWEAPRHSRVGRTSPISHAPHMLLSAGASIRRGVILPFVSEETPHGALALVKKPGRKAFLSAELTRVAKPPYQTNGGAWLLHDPTGAAQMQNTSNWPGDVLH